MSLQYLRCGGGGGTGFRGPASGSRQRRGSGMDGLASRADDAAGVRG